MSDINLDFTVNNNSINFTVEPNDITFTPEDIQLTFAQGILSIPGGSNTQLQYNNNGALGGIPNVTFNGSNISLGNVSTVKITGGTNGYVLQTDGTGNLDWTAQTGGGGGNGSPGGSNTQIQYNDSGAFGGNVGFTFNEVSGNVNVPSNLIAVGNITANTFIGNVANANYAAYAGNVTIASQPNITSLGTLTLLTVAGTTSIQQAKEKVDLNATGATGTINFDLLNQAILYKTSNSTSNFTVNIRGNSSTTLDSIMSNGESFTCTLVNKNGPAGYYLTNVQIDSNAITPSWAGNPPSTGTSNGIDSYTFNIIKTNSNTFTLLASAVGFQ